MAVTILITPDPVVALRAHPARMAEEGHDVEGGLVFCTRSGGFQDQHNMRTQSFLPILKRAGLPTVRPYVMRHTSATLLLSNGVSILVVSRRLGHERIETTLKLYGHLLPGDEGKAVEVLKSLLSRDKSKGAG